MKVITYGVDSDGLVMSRVGSEIAIPVLDYEKIGQGGDFTAPLEYHLEKFNVLLVVREVNAARWTKKIPVELKNRHRELWGMKPLKVGDPA